jgi:zinc resistance-associated protein
MWKPVVVVAAALTVASLSVVYAQQGYGRDDGNVGRRYQHLRMSAEDIAAFTDARIAALKAGLELTPDQAKNWPAFEQALRGMAELRAQRRKAREELAQNPTTITPFERLARRADYMSKASVALKRIADTGMPLYQSLGDAQKARFKKLARILRPHHHMHARNENDGHSGHGWRQGLGYGRDHERGGKE